MKRINLESLFQLGARMALLAPTVEARFVDGKKPVVSVRGRSVQELNDHLFYAVKILEAVNVEPEKGNVLYASGYTFLLAGKDSTLLARNELGGNPDGGLDKAWIFLGEVQESVQE